MRRREFLGLFGGVAVAWPLCARAQSDRQRRITVLFATGANDPETPPRLAAMREELQRDGWSEGRNLNIEVRFGNGDTKIIEEHAAKLIESRPDVALVHGTVLCPRCRKHRI